MKSNDFLTSPESPQSQLLKPSFDLDKKDPKENLRIVILLVAFFVGVGGILFYFFGEDWINKIVNHFSGSLWKIMITVVGSLFITSVIFSIVRGIFGSTRFFKSSEIPQNQIVFKLAGMIFYLIILAVIYSYLFVVLQEAQLFNAIQDYLEKGIPLKIEDGDAMIKLENGKIEFLNVGDYRIPEAN